MENLLVGLNDRFEVAEERISEFEDIIIINIHELCNGDLTHTKQK